MDEMLFNVHCTVAPSAWGVTSQLMEKVLSHIGANGEMDTVKKKEKGHISDIRHTRVVGFLWDLRAGLCFYTLDNSEHDLVFNNPICSLHPAREKSSILQLHTVDLQAVIAPFEAIVGAVYTRGLFV